MCDEPGKAGGYGKDYDPSGRARQMITLVMEPEGKSLEFPRPKTVWQLLRALGLEEESALVARDGKLLTPDRRIWPNDSILVRVVASRG